VGARQKSTAGVCAEASSANPRRHSLGGQASLGLFGVTDRCHAERAASIVKAQTPQADDRPRIIGGLSFGQRRARLQAIMSRPAPKPVPTFHDEAEAQYEAHMAEIAEARSHQLDAEADRYACTFAGAGYTEHLMAMEG
jgi:hypothetical protein